MGGRHGDGSVVHEYPLIPVNTADNCVKINGMGRAATRRDYSGVAIARQVNRSRRISLPQDLGWAALGPKAPMEVMWTRARNDSRTVMLRPLAPQPVHRAAGWVRTVTSVWQVPLPADMMTQIGLDIDSWVYLTVGSDRRSLRVTPASSVAWSTTPLGPRTGARR